MSTTPIQRRSENKNGDSDELERAAGQEQAEPGKPTRSMDERGEVDSDTAREVEEIAEQQGSSARGFTTEREEGAARPLETSPTHPDGSPDGDPLR